MTDLLSIARGTVESGRSAERRLRSVHRREGAIFRQRVNSAWRHVDLVLPLPVIVISVLSALMVLSSTRGTDPDSYDLTFMRRQIMYSVVGFVLMVLVMTFDYRRLRRLGWMFYAAVVVLLGLVLVIGSTARGTQGWFDMGSFQLQPAELAKLAAVVVVASLLGGTGAPLRLRWVGITLAVLGLPVALILLQPDLGTSLVFGSIGVGMLFMGGARVRHMAVLGTFVALAVVAVLTSDVLEDYQQQRLTTFMDQERQLGEHTYNLDQAQIALGSGGTGGKGFLEGTQTRLGIVPEQHTDFIFAALGEELGFAGTVTVLALYLVLSWRIWRTAQMARDRFGMLLCLGVLLVLVFQVFQNVGMTVGLMPITGIPLPFMSYGGSAIISFWLAIGIVQNVHMRRYR